MPVYQYEGKHYDLPEGLSNEQAIAKIETYLGVAPAAEQQQAPAAEPQQQQKPSMLSEAGRQVGLTARAGGQALADLAGVFTNPVTALVNQAAGQRVMTPIPELASQGMTAIGLPQPKNDLERAVQTGATAMAGTATQAGLATKAAEFAPAVKALADNLAKQLVVSGAAGTSSKAASDYAMELTNDPLAATAAALATGVVAGGLAGKTLEKGKDVSAFMQGKTKPLYSMEEIKNRAQASYRQMDEQNIYVQSKSIQNKLFSMFDDTLKEENFNPTVVDTHKPVAGVLNNIKELLNSPFLSFNKLEQIRSSLTDLKTSTDSATRRMAGKLVSDFDNYLGTISYKDVLSTGDVKQAVDSVKAARVDWRNLSRAETLEDALSSALVKSDRPTASQQELIRNAMINLAANNKTMRSFSTAEQNAIRAVAKGGSFDTLLSMLAKFNPERSQIVAGAQFAGAFSNPAVAAGSAAAGFAADKYLGYSRKAAADKLIKQIASGAVPTQKDKMLGQGLLSSGIYGQ